MNQTLETREEPTANFVDRRRNSASPAPVRERRQFANDYGNLSPAAAELGQAVDEYKVRNRRRFITYEELLEVVTSLGYHR